MKSILASMSFLLYSSLAFSGPISSGGGNALVCRNDSKGIIRAELFDLYEAKDRYHLTLPIPTGDLLQDLLAARRRAALQTSNPDTIDDETVVKLATSDVREFKMTASWTNPGETLPFLADQGVAWPPPGGCQLEQLALFDDNDQSIRVDSEIYAALDSLSQAALITHELDYYGARYEGEKTSELSRAFVAYSYAVDAMPPALFGLPVDSQRCTALDIDKENGWDFRIVRDAVTQEVGMQIWYMVDRYMLTRTTIDLPGIHWNLKEEAVSGNLPIVEEAGVNYSRRIPVQSAQALDLEIAVDYHTGQPVSLRLYQHGVLLQTEAVDWCEQKTRTNFQ